MGNLNQNGINKRNIGMCIILSIITFGIYSIYWEYLLVKNVRTIKNDDSSCVGEMLCLIFVPFYSLFWWFTRGKTVRDEFTKEGYSVSSNETVFLVLGLLALSLVSMAIMQDDFNRLPDSAKTVGKSNNTVRKAAPEKSTHNVSKQSVKNEYFIEPIDDHDIDEVFCICPRCNEYVSTKLMNEDNMVICQNCHKIFEYEPVKQYEILPVLDYYVNNEDIRDEIEELNNEEILMRYYNSDEYSPEYRQMCYIVLNERDKDEMLEYDDTADDTEGQGASSAKIIALFLVIVAVLLVIGGKFLL